MDGLFIPRAMQQISKIIQTGNVDLERILYNASIKPPQPVYPDILAPPCGFGTKRKKFLAKLWDKNEKYEKERSPHSWALAQTSIESAGLPMWNPTSGNSSGVTSHISLRKTRSSKTQRSRSILAKCLAHEKWLMGRALQQHCSSLYIDPRFLQSLQVPQHGE